MIASACLVFVNSEYIRRMGNGMRGECKRSGNYKSMLERQGLQARENVCVALRCLTLVPTLSCPVLSYLFSFFSFLFFFAPPPKAARPIPPHHHCISYQCAQQSRPECPERRRDWCHRRTNTQSNQTRSTGMTPPSHTIPVRATKSSRMPGLRSCVPTRRS